MVKKYSSFLVIPANYAIYVRRNKACYPLCRSQRGVCRKGGMQWLLLFILRQIFDFIMRLKFIYAVLLFPVWVCAQDPQRRLGEIFETVEAKPEVLLLGTFHFAGEQVDANTTPGSLRVDMLSPQRQQQIEELVKKLALFRPTKIAIEGPPQYQKIYDSLYRAYCAGQLPAGTTLQANELVQLSFRLARELHLPTLYPVDAQAFHFQLSPADSVLTFEKYKDQADTALDYWDHRYDLENAHMDTLKYLLPLKDFLRYLNDPEKEARDVGRWLIITRTGSNSEPIGADGFITRYFNRNVRIYSNIQRIVTSKTDRILVIYGATHMYFLKTLFAASPEFKLMDIESYLR